MKKKISLLISLVIALFLLTTTVSAAPSPNVSITGPTSAEANSEIAVKLTLSIPDIEETTIITGVSITVPYDKDVLTYLSAEKANSATMNIDSSTAGELKILLQNISGIDTTTTTAQILTINFKTKSLTETKTVTIEPTATITFDPEEEVNGTSNIYTFSVEKIKEAPVIKSNNNYLKTLSVLGYNLDKTFSKEVKEYTTTVSNNTTEAGIVATTDDTKATVSISGDKNLKTGKNIVTITVTAEDGSKRIYKITVTKPESDNNYLKSLVVEGLELKESFSKYKYIYTITVEPSIYSLNITALAEEKNAKVEIDNIASLEVGKNTITITVTAENGEKLEYVIEVTKKGEETLTAPEPEATVPTVLTPVKKPTVAVPIVLGTTGGLMLGAVLMLYKKKFL